MKFKDKASSAQLVLNGRNLGYVTPNGCPGELCCPIKNLIVNIKGF